MLRHKNHLSHPRLYTLALLIFMGASAQAALTGRLPDSEGTFQAYYDDQLKITWSVTTTFNGLIHWAEASTVTETLTIDGISGWRLPSMDVNGDGEIVDCSIVSAGACLDNEFGYQFYQNEVTSANPGPFDLRPADYWSGTLYNPTTGPAGIFNFTDNNGTQGAGNVTENHYAWAVHDGDVSAVPVPAAAWLFTSGLLGFLTVARRKG